MIIEYAKVTRIDGEKYYITFINENKESPMVYKKLKNYTPTINDIVAILVDSKGKKICLGGVN